MGTEERAAFWKYPRFCLRDVLIALVATAAVFYVLGLVTTVTVTVGGG